MTGAFLSTFEIPGDFYLAIPWTTHWIASYLWTCIRQKNALLLSYRDYVSSSLRVLVPFLCLIQQF